MKLVFGALSLLALVALSTAQIGHVVSHKKISGTEGAFTGVLDNGDNFYAVSAVGDFDGDGIEDLAVGARGDDDGFVESGAVWLLFMNADGTVRTHQKISATDGGFTGVLQPGDGFGGAVTSLGDLDGDSVVDLAVGAVGDEDVDPGCGTCDYGAVWILFMNADGTVRAHQKISSTIGGFGGALCPGDRFGSALAVVPDMDGDGTVELAVGAHGTGDGGNTRGAVWILFLSPDGTVSSEQKIGSTAAGFTGALDDNDFFGHSLASPGDLDGDGVADLIVGAPLDDDGCSPGASCQRGAIYVLYLAAGGTVNAWQKISATNGGFTGALDDGDLFGVSVAVPGDVDSDGVPDWAVGALRDDDGGVDRGAVWILFMNEDETVRVHQKVSDTAGGFAGPLDDDDLFGDAVSAIGDFDRDGVVDVAVGCAFDDDGGANRGAVWLLFLDADVVTYGCGFNPPGSMTVLGGVPSIGTTLTLGIDNPLGTQAVGSIPYLFFADRPALLFPCGIPLPFLGMSTEFPQLGELLIDLAPPNPIAPPRIGSPWTGAGTPVPMAVTLPNDPTLLDRSVYIQGVLVDPTSAFGVKFGLTDAVELRIGP